MAVRAANVGQVHISEKLTHFRKVTVISMHVLTENPGWVHAALPWCTVVNDTVQVLLRS